jgi:hypothetical protein
MNAFAIATYSLCALTAASCALLLLRGYGRSGMRLLFWAGICFVALTAENILLFVDLVVLGPHIDLSLLRNWIAVGGLLMLLFGLIWNARAT